MIRYGLIHRRCQTCWRDCPYSVSPGLGFLDGRKFDHALAIHGCRRIRKVGVAECQGIGFDIGKYHVSSQQHHRLRGFLQYRFRLAVDAQQDAVAQPIANTAHRIGVGAIVANGDVHRIGCDDFAGNGLDTFDLAWQGVRVFIGRKDSSSNADLHYLERRCAVMFGIDQGGATGLGDDDLESRHRVRLQSNLNGHRSQGGQPMPWQSRLAYADPG